jgi:hypothetical protein
MAARFTILGLMELTALIAIILAADRVVFGMGPQAFFVGTIAIGGTAGAYAGFRLRRDDTMESVIRSARLWSAILSLLNALAIGMMAAQGFRAYDYFEWRRDWLQLTMVVIMITPIGTALGMLLAMAPAAYLAIHKRLRQ